MDYVLNGPIKYPSGGPVFKHGYIAVIMPRGVKAYYDPSIYTPYLGKGSMGCCPDLSTPMCKQMLSTNSACPIKTLGGGEVVSLIPSPVPSTTSNEASRECGQFMCVQLNRPPEKMGATIDLMIHSTSVPLPLKFINVGKVPGSRVCFRKSHSFLLQEVHVLYGHKLVSHNHGCIG